MKQNSFSDRLFFFKSSALEEIAIAQAKAGDIESAKKTVNEIDLMKRIQHYTQLPIN
jgi:hypothetical protein